MQHSTDFTEFRPAGIWKSNFEGSKMNSNASFEGIFELCLTSLVFNVHQSQHNIVATFVVHRFSVLLLSYSKSKLTCYE